jgi:DNA-directed RNA polymerase specialized sigma24 family protein
MTALRKNKLQEAIHAIREVFYDAISCRVQYSGQSYAEIGSELGCSEQTVYQVARLRNLSRQVGLRPQSSSVFEEGQMEPRATGHSNKMEVANGDN